MVQSHALAKRSLTYIFTRVKITFQSVITLREQREPTTKINKIRFSKLAEKKNWFLNCQPKSRLNIVVKSKPIIFFDIHTNTEEEVKNCMIINGQASKHFTKFPF